MLQFSHFERQFTVAQFAIEGRITHFPEQRFVAWTHLRHVFKAQSVNKQFGRVKMTEQRPKQG